MSNLIESMALESDADVPELALQLRMIARFLQARTISLGLREKCPRAWAMMLSAEHLVMDASAEMEVQGL